MLFSIVIPTYNRLALLTSTLESVWAQSQPDFEMIVVDDGSTDGTMEYLHSLGSRVRTLRQANRGPGAARNAGAAIAEGRYLAFLDSDDVWFPWTLATYTEIIQQANEPAFIAGKPFRFASDSQLAGTSAAPASCLPFDDYYSSGDEWRWWGVSSFVIRRDAFTAAGGFADEWINAEDADLAMRLGDARGFVQISAPVTFGYREHAASAMKDINRTLAGIRHMICFERDGKYPGGAKRGQQRWRILARHIRPLSLECLRLGMRKEAWELYHATLGWHMGLARWKYLAGFPLRTILTRA